MRQVLVLTFASLALLAAPACSSGEAPTSTDGATNGSSGSRGASGASGSTEASSGVLTGSSSGSVVPGSSGTSSGASGQTVSVISLGAKASGRVSAYDADGTGNCGFDATNDSMIAALDFNLYAKSALCGGCMRITTTDGHNKQITVKIVDSCPACAQTGANIDLSHKAFQALGDENLGQLPVTYELVTCAVSGNLQYEFKDGSSQYWTAIQVRNSRVPVAKLEYKRGSTWTDMPRTDYNYFIVEAGVGPQPNGLALRVTSSDGQIVEDAVASISDVGLASGGKQFN